MKTSLPDFIGEINRSKKSGLLSVNIKKANTLLKLYFRDGELYHIACGDSKGAACLTSVLGGDFSSYFFMPDVALQSSDSTLPPLEDIVRFFNNPTAAVEVAPHPGVSAGQPPRPPAAATAALEALRLALIRQIGPAGAKVLSRIVEQKLNAASPPTRDDLRRLIDLLKQEIDNPADRDVFLKEANAIFS